MSDDEWEYTKSIGVADPSEKDNCRLMAGAGLLTNETDGPR
jgi:hypothetical protein